MRSFRLLASVAASVFMTTPPASASPWVSVLVTTSCGYSYVCAGSARESPGLGSRPDVSVTCSAFTPATVQATALHCFIRGDGGDVQYMPATLTQGSASWQAHVFPGWSLTSRVYQICVGAGYFDGTYHPPAGYQCGMVIEPGGATMAG